MWMGYEAGDCAIVISVKRAFKWCPKSGFIIQSHFFSKNRTRTKAIIHGFSWFRVKIQPTAKWTSFPIIIVSSIYNNMLVTRTLSSKIHSFTASWCHLFAIFTWWHYWLAKYSGTIKLQYLFVYCKLVPSVCNIHMMRLLVSQIFIVLKLNLQYSCICSCVVVLWGQKVRHSYLCYRMNNGTYKWQKSGGGSCKAAGWH